MFSEVKLKPSAVIDDRYEIVDFIGGGGMGSVYKAREIELGRLVALKVLHSSQLSTAEDLARFEREGQVLKELSHAGIAVLYRFSSTGGAPYIAMEYVEGRSLRDQLNKSGKMEPQQILKIALQAANALAHAHNRGVVHRDIKPENILLAGSNDAPQVKIVDFGLARFMPETGSEQQKLTATGMLVGSVQYMSPEQCRGVPAGPAADIYSLACVLYECLAGQPPFDADSPVGILHKHVNELPDPLGGKSRWRLPEGLEAVLMKALAKTTAERYATMMEFAYELQLVAAGQGKDVQAPAPVKPPSKHKRYFRQVAIWSGVFVVLAAYVLGFNESLLESTVNAVCGFMPDGRRPEALLSCAEWMYASGRKQAADKLLSEVAPSGRAIPWSRMATGLRDRAGGWRTIKNSSVMVRAYLLRSRLATKFSDRFGYLCSAGQYCCLVVTEHGYTSSTSVLAAQVLRELADAISPGTKLNLDSAAEHEFTEEVAWLVRTAGGSCYEDTKRLLLSLVDSDNGPNRGNLYLCLVEVTEQADELEAALKYAAIAKPLVDPGSLFYRGLSTEIYTVYCRQGQWQKALDEITAARKFVAARHYAYLEDSYYMMRAMMKLGEYKKAIKTAEDALADCAQLSSWRSLVLRLLVQCELLEGNYDRADYWLEETDREWPEFKRVGENTGLHVSMDAAVQAMYARLEREDWRGAMGTVAMIRRAQVTRSGVWAQSLYLLDALCYAHLGEAEKCEHALVLAKEFAGPPDRAMVLRISLAQAEKSHDFVKAKSLVDDLYPSVNIDLSKRNLTSKQLRTLADQCAYLAVRDGCLARLAWLEGNESEARSLCNQARDWSSPGAGGWFESTYILERIKRGEPPPS